MDGLANERWEMKIHEQIIAAVIEIAKENELSDTIEIVSEMNHAAHFMLEMPTHFKQLICDEK